VCQAHPRRIAKVASQIKREIGEMLIMDDVVAGAVCPERKRGFDGALSALASITDVYVSNDLQVVKAYVSIYSDPKGKEAAIRNLKRLEPYVRSQIGQRVRLRLTPQIRFELDNTLEEMEAVEKAIGRDDFQRYVREAQAEAGVAEDQLAVAESAAVADTAVAAEEEGFFDDLDEDEDEGWGVEEYGAWAQRPGPFDDLFKGSADGPLIQEAKKRQSKPAAAKKGQGGKKKRPAAKKPKEKGQQETEQAQKA